MILSMIAAVDQNRAIGAGGELLYSQREDLKRFKTLTKGRAVILGRKTYQSLPGSKPLAERKHYILSQKGFVINNEYSESCIVCDNLKSLMDKLRTDIELKYLNSDESKLDLVQDSHTIDLDKIKDINYIPNVDAYVIGGDSVYSQFIDKSDILEITEILTAAKNADSYFPYIDENCFSLIAESEVFTGIAYNFLTKKSETISFKYKRYIRK